MVAKKNTPPNGGKKGGAVFPRYDLEAAIDAAKRLVSKSHSAAVSKDIYFSGVLQVSGPRADVKSSALKQYGLLLGNTKEGFTASPLAKRIATADVADKAIAIKEAALSPRVFKGMFEAFRGDPITKTRLRQRASEMNVHPDVLDNCVKIYIESLSLAQLVRVQGDQVVHVAEPGAPLSNAEDAGDSEREDIAAKNREHDAAGTQSQVDPDTTDTTRNIAGRPGKASINVTISLDSSLDTEKLERQLALLKKFGAI